jgi:hypothetical protein
MPRRRLAREQQLIHGICIFRHLGLSEQQANEHSQFSARVERQLEVWLMSYVPAEAECLSTALQLCSGTKAAANARLLLASAKERESKHGYVAKPLKQLNVGKGMEEEVEGRPITAQEAATGFYGMKLP